MSASCSIDGCDNVVFSGGWCCGHYERWKRYGNPQFIPDSRKKKPLEGKVFGRLTVVSLSSETNKDHRVIRRWLCRCRCGNPHDVAEQALLGGRTISCGCARYDPLTIDLSGQTFGRWTVVQREQPVRGRARRGARWICTCACGNTGVIRADILKNGGSTSCGCWQRESASTLAKRSRLKGTGKAAQRCVWNGYKKGALKRGYDFLLTYADFCTLTEQPCFYCGDAAGHTYAARYASGQFVGNGIDRYDNAKGYTKENCVPCCKRCNWAKRELHGDTFITMCNAIAARRQIPQ